MARKPMATLPDVFAKPGAAPARGTPIEALPQDDAAAPDRTDMSASTDVAPSTPDAPSAAVSSPGSSVSAAPAGDGPAVTPAPVAADLSIGPSARDAGAASGQEAAAAVATTATIVAPPTAAPAVSPAAEAARPAATGDGNATPGPKGVPPAPAATTTPPAAPPAKPIDPPKPAVIPPPAPVASSAPRPVAAPSPGTPSPGTPLPDRDRVHVAAPAQDAAPSPPAERGAAWGIAIAALAVSLTTPFWYDGALRLLGIVPSLHRAQLEDALAVSRQERKLREVEQRLSTASSQLARTQADLAQANRVQQEAAAWTRMVVAARLAEAVRSGRPFVSELAVAQASNVLAGDVAAMAAIIAPYAPIGVPSMDDLARDFRRLTDPVLRPARGLNPLAWASAALSYLPFGRAAPDANPGLAALREAAALIEVRRTFEAAALLRPLTGPVREAMAGWLADVDARAAAEALDRRVDAALRPGRS